MNLMNDLTKDDPEITKTINSELQRQEQGIELIPSENYVSKAVLQAMGSVFTNKYSEGYSHKRYYGGQVHVDEMEDIAIRRAKDLFGCEHVNVQPYSGSPANLAVYFTLLDLKDKFMGFDLTSGGHLTHGSPVSFSGNFYEAHTYNVDEETHLIDFDQIRKKALQVRPKMMISGHSAYPRKFDFKAFQDICDEVEAYHFSDIAHLAGLVAGKAHMSPIPYADVVTTTTHKTLRGPRGAIIMSKLEDRYKEKYHPEWKKNLASMIDFRVFPGLQGGPHDHTNAAKAVAFKEALTDDFEDYASQIVKNAKAMAESMMDNGLKLVTDGTDNHLCLIDLTRSGFKGKGKEVQNSLDQAAITVNKNTIPYEPGSPFNPSGIRLGTPAVTTRGMKEPEMKVIGEQIANIINSKLDEKVIKKSKQNILDLTKEFPLYPGLEILK